jgi:hypothetical protein
MHKEGKRTIDDINLCKSILSNLKGGIAKLVLHLLPEAHFRPSTTKTATFVLEVSQRARFGPWDDVAPCCHPTQRPSQLGYPFYPSSFQYRHRISSHPPIKKGEREKLPSASFALALAPAAANPSLAPAAANLEPGLRLVALGAVWGTGRHAAVGV